MDTKNPLSLNEKYPVSIVEFKGVDPWHYSLTTHGISQKIRPEDRVFVWGFAYSKPDGVERFSIFYWYTAIMKIARNAQPDERLKDNDARFIANKWITKGCPVVICVDEMLKNIRKSKNEH